jgi:hypothetical protein
MPRADVEASLDRARALAREELAARRAALSTALGAESRPVAADRRANLSLASGVVSALENIRRDVRRLT